MTVKFCKILSVACATAFLAFSAAADIVLDFEGEKTLSQALTDKGFSLEAVNGGANKSSIIQKSGTGTLVLDTAIPNYAAEKWVIEKGIVYCKVKNAFGASSVQVAVRSGATVKMATDVKDLNKDRVFYINGTGYNNMGVLTLDGYGNAGSYGYDCTGIFGKVSLQGDAMVKSCNHHYVGDTISLNAHTYTIESYSGNEQAVYSSAVYGSGKIVLKDVVLRGSNSNLSLDDATATNEFDYLSGGAGPWFWNAGGQISGNGKAAWRHVFSSAKAVIKADAGSSTSNADTFQRETSYHRIFGPVEIQAGANVTMSGQANTGDYALKISGVLSGSGSFATSANIPSVCHVLNPANTFTGTFKVNTGIFYFYEPGTLPSGAALQLNGANDYVRASGSTDPLDVPAYAGVALAGVGAQQLGNVTVTGAKTRRLFGGETGSFGAVSKDGAGTFEYFTALDAGAVTLKAGTLKLPRGAKPGLYEYYQDYADAATAKAALASFDPSAATHKYVMRGALSSSPVKTDNYTKPGDKRIIAYEGYIWNRTGAARKVTLLTSINGDDKIKVGDNAWETCCKSNFGNPWFKTYTLQPGATKIQYVAYDGGPKAKNGWKANCGVAYTDDGVDYGKSDDGRWTDVRDGLVANGKPLVDPGDGSLLTLSADAALPVFTGIVGQGGSLDLNGNAYALPKFTGTLSVKSSATDAAADAKLDLGGLALKTSDLNSAVTLNSSVPVTLGTAGVITLTEEGTLSTPSSFTVTSPTPIDFGGRDVADCVVVPQGWTAWLAPDGKTLLIDRQIELNITADTASLADALTAAGHTLADITTGAFKNTTLVKKGSGTLTLGEALTGYAGKWVIEGGVVYQKVANAFGPASVPVYVYDGGAVKVFGNSITINSSRSFYIAGTGCNKSGALFLDGDGTAGDIGYNASDCYGNVYLTADATVCHRNYHSIGRQVHLNGHTYTVKYVGGNRAAYTYGIYGAGKVICDGVYLRTGGNNGTIELADATPGNEIVYKNNGGGPWFFQSGQFTGDGVAVWKQTYQDGAAVLPQGDAGKSVFGRENASMVIKGPIEVQQDLKLIEGQGNIGNLLARWKGVVSGAGTVTAAANAPTVIDLFNSANTFSGTINNEKGLVNVYDGASLPAAASVSIGGDADHGNYSNCLPLEFAGLEFYGPDEKTLGALTIKGSKTRRVQGGSGAWATIVKDGSGTAEYYSALGAGKLTLKAGTFKLAKAGNVGLYEGVVDYPDATQAYNPGFLGSAYPHHFVVRGPIATAQLKGQNYPSLTWQRVVTYEGYFWNRTGETQTYAFYGNLQGQVKLFIDDQQVFWVQNGANAKGSVTLTPGAHSFRFRGNYPAPDGNNLGLGWKLGEATDTLADYTQILDPGDGSVFTLTSTEVQPVFEEITGTSTGALLDLNGTVCKAAKLSGSFTIGSSVAGGRLDLTGGLAVDASKLTKGDKVVVSVPVDFGATGKITVTGLDESMRGPLTLIAADEAIGFGGRDIASAFTVDNPSWTVVLKDGGKSLVLKRLGLTVIVR